MNGKKNKKFRPELPEEDSQLPPHIAAAADALEWEERLLEDVRRQDIQTIMDRELGKTHEGRQKKIEAARRLMASFGFEGDYLAKGWERLAKF
jgi:hypothetical protein